MPVRLSRERETKRRMRKGEKPAPPPPPKPTTHRKKAKRSNIAAVSRKEAGVRSQPKQNRKKNDTEIHFFWLTPAVDRSFVRSPQKRSRVARSTRRGLVHKRRLSGRPIGVCKVPPRHANRTYAAQPASNDSSTTTRGGRWTPDRGFPPRARSLLAEEQKRNQDENLPALPQSRHWLSPCTGDYAGS